MQWSCDTRSWLSGVGFVLRRYGYKHVWAQRAAVLSTWEVNHMPIDPVCGVQVDEEDAVTFTYKGRTYYFCCDDCRDEFREAPEEYVGEGTETMEEEE